MTKKQAIDELEHLERLKRKAAAMDRSIRERETEIKLIRGEIARRDKPWEQTQEILPYRSAALDALREEREVLGGLIARIGAALDSLTPEERHILEKMYVRRTDRAWIVLSMELFISKSELYRRAEKALRRYARERE